MADETPKPDQASKPAPDTSAERALAAAQSAVDSLKSDSGIPLDLPTFSPVGDSTPTKPIDLLSDVLLHVKIELGRTRMLVEDVLRLGDGAVIELDKLAGDPVDVYVNERLIARGEVLVLNDNFCVRINEIVAPADAAPIAKSA